MALNLLCGLSVAAIPSPTQQRRPLPLLLCDSYSVSVQVLLTGLHAVADIYCDCCKTTLGWKYEHAFESSQKYKEGKYIIELAHMIKENGWEKGEP